MFQEVRVAAISFKPEKWNVTSNADRLEAMFREAAVGGAQLAVGPEGILEGYVVNEIIDGEMAPEQINDVALHIKSDILQRFQDLAKELRMCLVFGLAERIGDEIYNCAVFLNDTGHLCGKYHKMQLAEHLRIDPPSIWDHRFTILHFNPYLNLALGAAYNI